MYLFSLLKFHWRGSKKGREGGKKVLSYKDKEHRRGEQTMRDLGGFWEVESRS